MTQRVAPQAPPRPASLYAPLTGGEANVQPERTSSQAVLLDQTIDLAEEGRRLGALRQALWKSFAADAATVPVALVDIVMAYTQALRLQITLGQQLAFAKRRDRLLQQNSSARGA